MKTNLEQFQVDYYENGVNAVVGSEWLQQVLKERDKLRRDILDEKHKVKLLEEKVSRLESKVMTFELNDKNIYILDTLA